MTDISDSGGSLDQDVAEPVSSGYQRFALGLLLVIYTLNFLDRQVVNILGESIKHDLHLADWQLGLMTGFAFAILYTFLGIPIARLAEVGHRPRIIASAVAVWSLFTALCGLAQNFWHLILARVGVGIGEAGCSPPAHSLISDYVPKSRRASAIAFYSMGNPLGSLIGLAMGGLIADAYGWRAAFLVAGIPGLLFAVVVLFGLIEPRKQLKADLALRRAEAPSFQDALRILATKPTFWWISFGVAIVAFIGYGQAPFSASFFLREHKAEIAGLAQQLSARTGTSIGPTGLLGIVLSLTTGIAGVAGTLLGGAICDRLGAKDARAFVLVPALASLLVVPIYLFGINQPHFLNAVSILVFSSVLGAMWQGPIYATVQSVVEPRMRATCAAIVLFIANLIGLGLGPVFVGALSDYFSGPMGMGEAEGVRWALIVAIFLALPAAWLFWKASKTIREDIVS
jgi:MFS family permease